VEAISHAAEKAKRNALAAMAHGQAEFFRKVISKDIGSADLLNPLQ